VKGLVAPAYQKFRNPRGLFTFSPVFPEGSAELWYIRFGIIKGTELENT
jgi:hypothetical protein